MKIVFSDLFKKILNPINENFQKTKITKDEIKNIILVGGITKITKIEIINFPNSKINNEFELEIIIIKGTAKIKVSYIQRISTNKILQHSISFNKIVNENGSYVEIYDFIIKKGTILPTSSEFEWKIISFIQLLKIIKQLLIIIFMKEKVNIQMKIN